MAHRILRPGTPRTMDSFSLGAVNLFHCKRKQKLICLAINTAARVTMKIEADGPT